MKLDAKKVMRYWMYWLLSGVLLGITACTTPGQLPLGQVHEQIARELQLAVAQNRATQNQAANNNPLAQAFLPPVSGVSSKKKEELRFDLAVNQAPAQQVFMALVSDTKYSMSVSPDVSGLITVNLKSVTVREALEAIRETYGYEYTISGNRIVIQPNTFQTRIFQINYLASKRLGASDLSVAATASPSTAGGSSSSSSSSNSGSSGSSGSGSSGSGGQGSSSSSSSSSSMATSRVQTSYEIDFWKTLETALNAIIMSSPSSSSITPPTPALGSSSGNTANSTPTASPVSPSTAIVANMPVVITNPVSGVVLVRAKPRDIRLVEDYLKATQLVVERQVMLEAKIVEVTLNQNYQAGINWAAFGSAGRNAFGIGVGAQGNTVQPLSASGAGQAIYANGAGGFIPGNNGTMTVSSLAEGFFGMAFQSTNFGSLINFLETQGSVSVLSNPRIATLNNQKAVLKVGTDEVFITGFSMTSTVTANSTSSVPTATTSTLFSGILLDVMPQIDDDDNIILHIHPSVSRVTEKVKSFNLGAAGAISLPLAARNVNEADSIVRVRNGNIVAIGGLMGQGSSADRNGLPGTLDQSYGALLGQRSSSLSKYELVILLKSTIISGSKTWAEDAEEIEDRVRRINK